MKIVKLGQIASQQSGYIPQAYCDELAKLRSKVAPMDLATVHAQIEKYLGKPVKELFATFEDNPLGSASIAQVHRATLFDGTVVGKVNLGLDFNFDLEHPEEMNPEIAIKLMQLAKGITDSSIHAAEDTGFSRFPLRHLFQFGNDSAPQALGMRSIPRCAEY